MRDAVREQLDREITRKQFLQILLGALLTILGFNNILHLLSGGKLAGRIPGLEAEQPHGFGSSKFGV